MCITKRKKICWVTPDAFLDTDMDYKIMSGLLKHFDIYWFVVFGRNNRYKEADFKQLIDENPNLTVKFIYFTARGRYPSNANSTSKCKITKCFCKSTPLVLRNSISFLVSH